MLKQFGRRAISDLPSLALSPFGKLWLLRLLVSLGLASLRNLMK